MVDDRELAGTVRDKDGLVVPERLREGEGEGERDPLPVPETSRRWWRSAKGIGTLRATLCPIVWAWRSRCGRASPFRSGCACPS